MSSVDSLKVSCVICLIDQLIDEVESRAVGCERGRDRDVVVLVLIEGFWESVAIDLKAVLFRQVEQDAVLRERCRGTLASCCRLLCITNVFLRFVVFWWQDSPRR